MIFLEQERERENKKNKSFPADFRSKFEDLTRNSARFGFTKHFQWKNDAINYFSITLGT